MPLAPGARMIALCFMPDCRPAAVNNASMTRYFSL